MSRADGRKRRAPSPRPAQQPAREPAFRDLLDHLGRLLAEEYVKRLHESLPATNTPSKKEAP